RSYTHTIVIDRRKLGSACGRSAKHLSDPVLRNLQTCAWRSGHIHTIRSRSNCSPSWTRDCVSFNKVVCGTCNIETCGIEVFHPVSGKLVVVDGIRSTTHESNAIVTTGNDVSVEAVAVRQGCTKSG